ncbi:MAG: hypothetical protein ACRD1H_15240 [Vicinamibacterales bacterium]
MLPINRNPSAHELRRFTRLWLPLFVAVAGTVVWWRLRSPLAAAGVWGIGGALVAVALSSAQHARTVFVGLQTITYPIGLVISTVALVVLFYGVFTPIGWTMRLIGRDPLRLRARTAPSHWTPYEQDEGAERAFRQF